jgi:hypothetical protein
VCEREREREREVYLRNKECSFKILQRSIPHGKKLAESFAKKSHVNSAVQKNNIRIVSKDMFNVGQK